MDLSRVQRDTARRDRRSSVATVTDSETRTGRAVRSSRRVIPGSEADRFFHERTGGGDTCFLCGIVVERIGSAGWTARSVAGGGVRRIDVDASRRLFSGRRNLTSALVA